MLEAVRLTGALFFLVEARTPWVAEAPASTQLVPVILPDAQHIVSYHVVSQGPCWCESPGQAPLRLETGDVLVVPHGHAYQLASACGLRTGWSMDEALGVVSGDGRRASAVRRHRGRRWIGAPSARLRFSGLRCVAVQPGADDTAVAGASASPR